MKDKNKDKVRKEHADFQDSYRRSSNFDGLNDEEAENLAIEGDGDVSLTSNKDKEDSGTIKDVLKNLESNKSNGK